MKFFNDDIEKRKKEIVLDESGKEIAIFNKGEFETNDKVLIEKLKAKGYEYEDDFEDSENQDETIVKPKKRKRK